MSNQVTFKPKELRVPPNAVEEEKALLGAIMLRPEVMHEIIDIINTRCFYYDRHKMIWEAMMDLHGKSLPIDLISLSSRLKETDKIDKIGGMSYLTEIVQGVPSASNAEYYARTVQKKWIMRNLISASEHIAELGFNEAGDLHELLDMAEKKLFEVTNATGSHSFSDIKSTLAEVWDQIDHLHKTSHMGELRGVSTGFKDLDNMLAGMQKSDLIILAARPSMGKTSLALDMARHAAVKDRKSVGIFSLEMSAQQLVNRMLSAESKVDSWKLRTGKNLQEADFGIIAEAMEKLSSAPIYIDDQAGNNILKMRAVARRLKSEKKLDLIVVDYLQLMLPVQSRNSDNVVQQVTEISRSLKNLAREMEVPVLALSQLSRAVEQRGGKPRLSDLRDSGSIEQDADVVMFIHREQNDDGGGRKQEAEILVEKHRNGPTGIVKLHFDNERTTFLSMDKSDFGDFNGM